MKEPDESVKFFFGKQPTPAIVTNLGNATPHGKASTRRTDNVKACNAAFLAALVDLQKRAKKAGANGVINIVSYYNNVEMASPTSSSVTPGWPPMPYCAASWSGSPRVIRYAAVYWASKARRNAGVVKPMATSPKSVTRQLRGYSPPLPIRHKNNV